MWCEFKSVVRFVATLQCSLAVDRTALGAIGCYVDERRRFPVGGGLNPLPAAARQRSVSKPQNFANLSSSAQIV